MSIWKELKKVVNSNFNKPLNEQHIDMQFYHGMLFTESTTYTVPETGIYKIICVGAGDDGTWSSSKVYGGGAGGVVVEKAKLAKGDTYEITFSSGNVSFGALCSATAASGNAGGSGTVTNGIVYDGLNGSVVSDGNGANGGDVGFFDPKYMSRPIQVTPNSEFTIVASGGTGLFSGQQSVSTFSGRAASGGGGFGAGAGDVSKAAGAYHSAPGAACVYIEPVYIE